VREEDRMGKEHKEKAKGKGGTEGTGRREVAEKMKK